MFGLLGGTIVGGGIAGGIEYGCDRLFQLPGALFVVIAVTVAGAWLSMRIPRWVEVTAGEVPATLSYRQGQQPPQLARRGTPGKSEHFDNRWAATSSPRCGATARSR